MGMIADLARSAGVALLKAAGTGPRAVAPYATTMRFQTVTGGAQRRGSRLLRAFADNNEWVRIAINYRKHQIDRATLAIVRVDDPEAPPDKNVTAEIRNLLRSPNRGFCSLRSLISQVVEDVLVIDAGVIEIEHNAGGSVAGLWPIDGASISIDPQWRGDPNKPRFSQWNNYEKVADFYTDEMAYIMHNPSTHRPIGWSPVEATVRIIEASLYGENYDYAMLKQTAPAGILDLGAGATKTEVEAFREYYNNEIAGTQNIAIGGGGGIATQGNSGQMQWIPFKNDTVEERAKYKQWLARIIVKAFEFDLTGAGLIDDVNRANSKSDQETTDDGLIALASLVQDSLSEIVAHIDPNHGVAFSDIVKTNDKQAAEIHKIYANIGVLTPNEIRRDIGMKDDVAWGDEPYPTTTTAVEQIAGQVAEQMAADGSASGQKALDFLEEAKATNFFARSHRFKRRRAPTPTANVG